MPPTPTPEPTETEAPTPVATDTPEPTATPEIAQEAHAFLRRVLREVMGDIVAERCRILYGGSANPDNAASLIVQRDLDGFLVGGASLDPDKFLTIIRACGS